MAAGRVKDWGKVTPGERRSKWAGEVSEEDGRGCRPQSQSRLWFTKARFCQGNSAKKLNSTDWLQASRPSTHFLALTQLLQPKKRQGGQSRQADPSATMDGLLHGQLFHLLESN